MFQTVMSKRRKRGCEGLVMVVMVVRMVVVGRGVELL